MEFATIHVKQTKSYDTIDYKRTLYAARVHDMLYNVSERFCKWKRHCLHRYVFVDIIAHMTVLLLYIDTSVRMHGL